MILPALLVAGGMILSTLIAVKTADSGRAVLAAPVLMTVFLVGAAWLSGQSGGPAPIRMAFFMGAAMFLASAIVASKNPGEVAALMPVLSVGGAVPVLITLKRGCPSSRDAA